MSISDYQATLVEKISAGAKKHFQIDLEKIAAEVPPKTELGDLAFPVAFELAKLLKGQTGEKQNPRAIAEILKGELLEFEFVQRVEIAGPGYLNVFYDRANFLNENTKADPLPELIKSDDQTAPKVCVEHTSVNPNKAAHIGHVRNSVLGDSFVRILRAGGKRVEVQNYIDNTGVQVADVVVGFIHLLGMKLADIIELVKRLESEGISFDYYCWDLYTRVGQEYEKDEELKGKRAEVLHLVEEGENETAELADFVATRNVYCILKTMERLSIRYDLLPRESEILHLHFWEKAFSEMKSREVIRFETEGKNSGCWVMPFESHTGTDEHDADKILVRSNGTVTYTGKDIAYQMWKLGLLGLDFNYLPFHTYENGKEVWITSPKKNGEGKVPHFGHCETVYNVIDSRQSYPQEVVKKGVATIFPEKGEEASVHLSYEMVALSPEAAEELGFELSEEDRKKAFVEMSGRKGLGVKADDLIDRLEKNALAEVASRNPEMPEEKHLSIARQIAIGALRYFLLKYTRNTVVVFDFKEALSFEGETGVYCQNAAVRFNSIFKKLEDNALENSQSLISGEIEKVSEVFSSEIGDDIWSLVALAARLGDTINQSVNASEPAILAKYNFNLAKTMHLFHHNHRIISEEDPVKRAVFVVIADFARRALTAGLNTLGIEVPERM
ncbi:MAG: arginine--tRNA ligase [Pyrinomonadaceae bacterium]